LERTLKNDSQNTTLAVRPSAHSFMKLVLNNGEDKTLGGTNGAEQADKVYFCAFQTKNKCV
jgi:hypothetical protein